MLNQLFMDYPKSYELTDFLFAFSLENPQFYLLLIVSAFTFFFGYMEYIYSFKLVRREGAAPFPVWMHTFYFAHDATGAVVFALASYSVGGFWFFTATSIALCVWTLFEIYNLYMCVTVEREEIWGHLYENGVSVKTALKRVVAQVVMFIAVVNIFRVFMHDPYMFKWFIITNVVMAIGPGLYWEARKTRIGASMKLAIVILLGTVHSFSPINMWALTTDYFSLSSNPWFYIIGVVSIAFAIRNVLVLRRLKPKPKVTKDGLPSIW